MGHFFGIDAGSGTFNVQGDELGDALAIANDRFGELGHNELQGVAEDFAILAVAGDRFVPGGTICEDENGVVGACVAVDGDAIEGVLDGVFDGAFEAGGVKFGVSGHEAEHSGHIGIDHAGSLGAATDTNAGAIEFEGDRKLFFMGVAGDDGFGDVIAILVAKTFDESGVFEIDPAHGKGESDDSGRTHGNFTLFQLETFRCLPGHVSGIFHAIRTGARIGISAVGDNGADGICPKVVLGNSNRRGFDPVLGEHPLRETFVF